MSSLATAAKPKAHTNGADSAFAPSPELQALALRVHALVEDRRKQVEAKGQAELAHRKAARALADAEKARDQGDTRELATKVEAIAAYKKEIAKAEADVVEHSGKLRELDPQIAGLGGKLVASVNAIVGPRSARCVEEYRETAAKLRALRNEYMALATIYGGRPGNNEMYAWQIQVKDLEDGTDLMFTREVPGFPAFGEVRRALQEVASLS